MSIDDKRSEARLRGVSPAIRSVRAHSASRVPSGPLLLPESGGGMMMPANRTGCLSVHKATLQVLPTSDGNSRTAWYSYNYPNSLLCSRPEWKCTVRTLIVGAKRVSLSAVGSAGVVFRM